MSHRSVSLGFSAAEGDPPQPLQVLLRLQGERCDCCQSLGPSPSQVGALDSAPPPQSPAPPLLLARPSLQLRRQLVVSAAASRGRMGGRWRRRSLPAGAEGPTQSEAAQQMEGGAADVTVGVDRSAAVRVSSLERLELLTEEGGEGQSLWGRDRKQLSHSVSGRSLSTSVTKPSLFCLKEVQLCEEEDFIP